MKVLNESNLGFFRSKVVGTNQVLGEENSLHFSQIFQFALTLPFYVLNGLMDPNEVIEWLSFITNEIPYIWGSNKRKPHHFRTCVCIYFLTFLVLTGQGVGDLSRVWSVRGLVSGHENNPRAWICPPNRSWPRPILDLSWGVCVLNFHCRHLVVKRS